MVTRIISGVVAAALMLTILLFGGVMALTPVLALLSGMAAFELLRAAGFGCRDRMPGTVTAAVAVLMLFVHAWAPVVTAAVYGLWVMVESVLRHETLSPERAAVKATLPLYALGGFTALAALRGMGEDGLFYVVLCMVIPWLSDTGAYFTGVFFGKHKLCPTISPKKTVEGFVGGWITSVVASVLAAYLYTLLCGHTVTVAWVSVMAVAAIGAPLSVFGDLFASVIKRRFGVKDYGKIMPGHGGVMDRFDSVLPVAALVLIWASVWPLL